MFLKSVLRNIIHREETSAGPFHEIFKGKDLSRSMHQKVEKMRREGYVEWPLSVHLETSAICNAKCNFCPYESMDRKGERMPDVLIEKIIDDLTDIPKSQKFFVSPYKVSDPFLESRLFDILQLVNHKLPNALIGLITNASALTKKKIEQLSQVKNIGYLYISLNYIDQEEYETVMGLPFDRTIERIETLHEFVANGQLPIRVQVSRVSEGANSDIEFVRWIENKFPAFIPSLIYRNDWIGDVSPPDLKMQVPDAPCSRWFDLSITATGEVAKCCMDAEAKYSHGDVKNTHALEIYQQPHLRRLRQITATRLESPAPCNRCTYLSFP